MITEVEAILNKSGNVTLDASGNGVVLFDPDNAHQRWEVTTVVVSTNQAATATVVPIATVARNTVAVPTASLGNQGGSSWSGNQETFRGLWHIGPCEFLSILFYPPAGQAGAPAALSGVTCTARIMGSKFTRRT